jgi:hypothetical protein
MSDLPLLTRVCDDDIAELEHLHRQGQAKITELSLQLEKLKQERDMFHQAERTWETEMMKAIGQDGVGSVSKAIGELKIAVSSMHDYGFEITDVLRNGAATEDCSGWIVCPAAVEKILSGAPLKPESVAEVKSQLEAFKEYMHAGIQTSFDTYGLYETGTHDPLIYLEDAKALIDDFDKDSPDSLAELKANTIEELIQHMHDEYNGESMDQFFQEYADRLRGGA